MTTFDLDATRAFLNIIAPGEDQFTFQTFADADDAGGSLVRMLHGTLDQHAGQLQRLNNQGAGVFVTVNKTDLTGRKVENIRAVRAVFVDLDGAPLEPILAHPIKPHIIVETSPQRWPAYWRVEGMELDAFEGAQLGLIAKFGADKNVKDLPRVMRLPGFFHRKSDPFLVRITSTRELASYAPANFPRAPSRANLSDPPSSVQGSSVDDKEDALSALEDAVKKVAETPNGGRNNFLNKAAYTIGGLIGAGLLDEDAARQRLTEAADEAGIARKAANATITSGFTAGGKAPWTPSMTLDPQDPMRSARKLIDMRYTGTAGHRLVHRHREEFWIWNGSCFVLQTNEDMRAAIYNFTERARVMEKDGPQPFKPNSAKVTNIADALAACSNLNDAIDAPAWLEGGSDLPPPYEFMAVQNGLLHLPTCELWAPTPTFFNTAASSVAFNADAPSPRRWQSFLAQLFADDAEACQALQEFIGYSLSTDTTQQKMLLLVGPPRSGKGTIGRVLQELAGPQSVAGPTMGSLSGEFGLELLIPRPIAIISDARIGAQTNKAAVTERLLSISGEDTMSVNRKNKSFWTGKLQTRFIILTNELPALADGSGALANRFIIIPLTTSFLGKEDQGLFEGLKAELPGILNWAIDGYHRLRARGHFIQPKSAVEAMEEMLRLGSPVRAFINEECELGAGYEELADNVWDRWKAWCVRNGNQPGSKSWFGRNLKTVVPGLGRKDGGYHAYVYVGLQLDYKREDAERRREAERVKDLPF